MDSTKVDKVNILLILISLILAIKLPVEVFLFSYAILGPLHYMTEIGWLKKRGFFTKKKKDYWVLIALSVFITISFIAIEINSIAPDLKLTQQEWYINFTTFSSLATGGVILFAFCTALCFALIENTKHRIICILLALTLALVVHYVKPVWLLFGVFIPTIVHVSIFTGAFMFYGALKSKSRWGYLSTALFFIALISFIFIDIDPSTQDLSIANQERILDSNFIHLGASLSEFLGIHEEGAQYNLLTSLGLKIQALFAFSYTYHYLNWFSKTKIINWHNVSYQWLIFTGIIWIASISLYAINYKIGLVALFFLSLIHVFLEFPLNHISIIGIGSELKQRITTKVSN